MGTRTGIIRVSAIALGVFVLALPPAAPASAHEDDDEGGSSAADLIRQAIALIVNSPEEMEEIDERIDGASNSSDTVNVDIDALERAHDAFEADDLHRTRALLELSIGAKPHINVAEPPPIRETTPPGAARPVRADAGNELIPDPLDARPTIDATDWVLLGLSIGISFAGVFLGLRWRPAHGRRLHRRSA